MEISCLSEDSLKIKGKKISLAVDPDPSLLSKALFPLALFLTKKNRRRTDSENTVLFIEGAGEYEAAGVKISAFGQEKLSYELRIDGFKLFLADKDDLLKNQFEDADYNIIVLRADSPASDLSMVSGMPSYLIFYGKNAIQQAKALGKEDAPTGRLQIKEIPEKPEIAVLGYGKN
ncbi:hypothetical protein M1615_04985 [Patescibacteria group bacterium]|nr:hypothetical protein [Patescibacteria group bacterium]MCL5010345.1 hypothetical protein [Patescibacteria group bacterium]